MLTWYSFFNTFVFIQEIILDKTIYFPCFKLSAVYFLGQVSCIFEKLEGPVEKNNSGNPIGSHYNVSYDDCTRRCNDYEPCQSFMYNNKKKACYFRDKQMTGNETLMNENPNYFSAYKSCIIRNSILIKKF